LHRNTRKWRYIAIMSDPTTKLNQIETFRKASCIAVWSAKKTVKQLVKSVLIAGVFASAIECFYVFVLRAWGTVILDFILSWIMLSVFVMLFFYASERDCSQKSLAKNYV
jgi:hypothetical protein